MARDTIPDRLRNNARARGTEAAMWHREAGPWQSISWQEYSQTANRFGGALLALGYEPGQCVAIISNNRSEWMLAALGAQTVRAVPVGVYQTLKSDQAAYVVGHCEAKVAVVEDQTQYDKLAAERESLPNLKAIVVLKGAEAIDDPLVHSFGDFLATGDGQREAVEARFAELQDDDLATLIYTSGTTGPPKGVMLTHKNVAFTALSGKQMIGVGPNDAMVSYLPLSHIAEQVFSVYLAVTAGFPIFIAAQFDLLKETLLKARPTIFMGVPRVWEKFKAALEIKLGEVTGLKSAIVNWARKVGAEVGPSLVEQGEPSGLSGFKHRLAGKLFYSKLAGQLGLDRLKVAVTGAAPIGKDVLDFFLSIGIVIHEVYGQSEDCGPSTFNQPAAGKRRIGTVGLPWPEVEVKIAEDGEILVRGDNVFRGYFKNPEATAETLIEGWLHSGDIGSFDAQGFLRITDRKKDLIITAGGKNVAPQNIEKRLKAIPGIGQAVVIGDRRKFLTALLTIDAEAGPALGKRNGWPTDPDALATHSEFVAHVEAGVKTANGQLAKYEGIKRHVILPADFTVETGELTPTQKVKRKVVGEKYAVQIEQLYEGVS